MNLKPLEDAIQGLAVGTGEQLVFNGGAKKKTKEILATV